MVVLKSCEKCDIRIRVQQSANMKNNWKLDFHNAVRYRSFFSEGYLKGFRQALIYDTSALRSYYETRSPQLFFLVEEFFSLAHTALRVAAILAERRDDEPFCLSASNASLCSTLMSVHVRLPSF